MDPVFRTETRRRKETIRAIEKKAAVKQLPSLGRSQHLFDYDGETGLLARRVSTSSNARQGAEWGEFAGHLR